MWKTSNISSSLNDLSQNQNKVPNGNSTTSPPFKKISQKERKRQISINQTPTKPKESERKMASISKAKPATVAWLEDHFRFFFCQFMWQFIAVVLFPVKLRTFDNTRRNILVRIYLFKVKNFNIRTMCQICSKLTIKTPEMSLWCLYC